MLIRRRAAPNIRARLEFVTNWSIISDTLGHNQMSASNKIRQIIDTLPENEPFSSNRFRHFASPDNIKKILSRLATQGRLNKSSGK